jgi:hypothetical protein
MKASPAPDPRLSKLVQQLDAEHRLRVAAERRARALRLVVNRLLVQRKSPEQEAAERREAVLKAQAASK